MHKGLCLPEVMDLREFIRLWNERDSEWDNAFLKTVRRRKEFTPIDAVTFDNVTTTKTSESIYSAPYDDFLLLINLDITSTPTDIIIDVEFSQDNAQFFKLMNAPFGSLMYEDSAGDIDEALHGRILADYMRIKATATGTDATNKFALTLIAILTG